jgi:hypothetical protein
VADSEFGNTNRVRSEVECDQACRSGHGVKGLNRRHEFINADFCLSQNALQRFRQDSLVVGHRY